MSGPGVLLVSLPMSAPRYPSLALGLLKAEVRRLGVVCDVRYFSLDFVEAIGRSSYAAVSDERYYTAMAGEWVFAEAAHDGDEDALFLSHLMRDYLTEVFTPKCPKTERVQRLAGILAARAAASDFIERCVESIDWSQYRILGVTTSFQQNMASLAFARRVKARHPDILVVFGGANCQGDMGLALHHHYPFIDAICMGEGDRVFPELVRRHGIGASIAGLAGMVVRAADGMSTTPDLAVDQIDDLDSLPYPDFSDFYDQRNRLPAMASSSPAVMFETARGCWWGAKHHCTFCGLNGRMMSYRSKSQQRAYDELHHIVTSYGADVVNADAILDLAYFDDFVPRLADRVPKIRMFWQMKANIRPAQLALLARAGIKRIQPGIEALDTELLTLMRKGCTMIQNVQLLKIAAECGLSVAWNLLYGFPGENPAAYERTARLLPKLRHLQPPVTSGRVFADRFSPYFQNPEMFSVRIEPVPAYQYIYPFADESVRNLAYHFHMYSESLSRAEEIAAPMKYEQASWRKHATISTLWSDDTADTVTVHDGRWGLEQSVHTYTGAEAELLRLCWRIRSLASIHFDLKDRFDTGTIKTALETLMDRNLIVKEGSECVSLVLRQPGYRRAPTWAEVLRGAVLPFAAVRGVEGALAAEEIFAPT